MKYHPHLLSALVLALLIVETPQAEDLTTHAHDLAVVTSDPFEMDDFDLDPIESIEITEIRPVHTLMEDPDLPDDWTLDDIDVSDDELPTIDLPTLGPDRDTPLGTDFTLSSGLDDFDDPDDLLFMEDPSLLTDPSINAYWMEDMDIDDAHTA